MRSTTASTTLATAVAALLGASVLVGCDDEEALDLKSEQSEEEQGPPVSVTLPPTPDFDEGKAPEQWEDGAWSIWGLRRDIDKHVEEGENGIRCTAVYPGEVDTAMLDTDHQRLQPGDEGLVLAPEDVAAAVIFVARSHPRALIEDLSLRPSRHRRS